jgi:hypothetical protein
MSQQRSSPYLILGVPFGAGRNEVAKGFARAVKRLRQMEDPPFELEDLNWAQHEIDHREGVAEHSLDDFRVPADPTAYEFADPVSRAVSTTASTALGRQTPPTHPSVIEQLRIEGSLAELKRTVVESLTQHGFDSLPPSYTIREDLPNGT